MRQRLEKGTEVKIQAQGITVTGLVKSADNWGTETNPNWYIEVVGYREGYRYWKQNYDGGQLVEVDGKKVVHLAKA